MEKFKILLADDEEGIVTVYKKKLESEGHEVVTACDGEAALAAFYQHQQDLDLVVLDVMMPNRTGIEVCQEIKRINAEMPVVMLTALDSEENQLEGIGIGADDYISKADSPKLIVAKITRQLSRVARRHGNTIECGEVRMDMDVRQVSVKGNPVRLSLKEWELLRYLMVNHEKPLSREQLIKSVWQYEYYEDTRTLDTHIKKLRKALGDCGSYIQTLWSYGYKFSEKVPVEGRMIYDSCLTSARPARR